MSNADWFAAKLAGQKPRPVVPQTIPAQPVPSAPAQPVVQAPSKAMSTRASGTCPQCMSGNYMQMQGSNYQRCYDCGYPIVQSTSGMGGVKSEGKVTPARQPAKGEGFQPGTIVGRIE